MRQVARKGYRTLVTVLTKRMAEDLTEYMHEQGIRVRYMHSDIDTLERIEIIRDLRLGAFDVLVGINLLREGLDIPECALVAILDADKEGFLRSETVSIQTIGRAARNVDGQVILYADHMTGSHGARHRRDRAPPREADRLQRGQRHHAREHQAQHPRHHRQRLRAGPRHRRCRPRRDATPRWSATTSRPCIDDLEKQMREAAADLEFEKAARLRDEIKRLRETELAIADDPLARQADVEDKAGAYAGHAQVRRRCRVATTAQAATAVRIPLPICRRRVFDTTRGGVRGGGNPVGRWVRLPHPARLPARAAHLRPNLRRPRHSRPQKPRLDEMGSGPQPPRSPPARMPSPASEARARRDGFARNRSGPRARPHPARAPKIDPRTKAGAYGEQVKGPHKPTLDEMGPHAERGLPVAGKPAPAQADEDHRGARRARKEKAPPRPPPQDRPPRRLTTDGHHMAKPGDAFPTLLTKRLRLRPFEPRDAAGLHACFGDPEAMRFWDFPTCKTISETEKVLAWLGKTTSPYERLAWAVADRSKDRCIGMLNYHHREARNKRLELGYIVAPGHQGRGLGTEATRAVLDYCVGTLGAHRVHALINPENRASIKLAERLGFRCEGGPLTDYWCVAGRYLDAMLWAFIAPATRAAATPAGRTRRSLPVSAKSKP